MLNPEAEMFRRSELPGKYTTKIFLGRMIESLKMSI